MNRLVQKALRCGVHLMLLTSDLLGDDWLSRRMRIALFRLFGARLGAGTSCHGGTHLTAPARLRTGRDCFVNRNCYLDLERPIVLGDDVVLGHGTTLITTRHEIGGPRRRAGHSTARAIRIGDGASIGANVTVLPGVTIGAGAVIGAGSVVTRDVSPDNPAAGVLARVLRSLADQDGSDEMGAR